MAPGRGDLRSPWCEGVPGGIAALDRLDLTVHAGKVFCLLGPNGAGKTATVHRFLNFIPPSSGQALVCGIDSARDPLAARRIPTTDPVLMTDQPEWNRVYSAREPLDGRRNAVEDNAFVARQRA